MTLSIFQANPPINPLVAPPLVSIRVISPISFGPLLQPLVLNTSFHAFLLALTKDGTTFWVGAAVPFGTLDFTRAQVFFHPTVVQSGKVIAADADYGAFTGGWLEHLHRYVALQGAQLAGARLMPLIVPFTTMGALSNPALNMFSVDPIETLNAIVAELQQTLLPVVPGPGLSQLGVSSFSSGITALRLFLSSMNPSGLVKEVIDFDSPFITAEPKQLTLYPGAVSKCYTQVKLGSPPANWNFFQATPPPDSFAAIPDNPPETGSPNDHAHACIGFMMYHLAMLTSVII